MLAKKKSSTLGAALLIVLLVVATGCRNKTAPATEVPAGFVQVSDHDSGITIAIPSEWVQLPLPKNENVAKYNETALALVEQNPRLLPAVNQGRVILQSGGEIFAVSPDGQTRVNITVGKAKEKTVDQLVPNVVPQLEQSGAKNVTQERVTTGAGPGLKLRFQFPVEVGGSETVLADEVQYIVLHDGKSYVLTLISPAGDVPDTIARSLRIS